MNGNGNRKLKGFYVTIGIIFLVIETAILIGVSFTGDNIIALSTVLAAVGGMFFGANFGEHWSAAKKSEASNQ